MKISPLLFPMLGLVIGVAILSYMLFQVYIPTMGAANNLRAFNDALDAEANKENTAKRNLEEAKRQRQEVEAEWNEIVLAHTPPSRVEAGGIDLTVNGWQLTVDAQKFRNNVQRAVNAQLKKGGVTVVAGPTVPEPGVSGETILADYFNYPGFQFPAAVFNLGTVTVRGTFAQISQNVRAWSSMPRYMAVVDGLNISGTSPQLTATYNLTVVAIVRADTIAPALPSGGGAAAGGAGGFPGMPPGMGGMFGPPGGPGGMGGPPRGFGGPGGPTGGGGAAAL